MAIRYEANIDGSIEPGNPFVDFNESSEMTRIFNGLGWAPELVFTGVGGYNVYNLVVNGLKKRLHVYLKKLTFGGRVARPYEKRAQFPASIDRRGLEATQDDYQSTVFFALYKRSKSSSTIVTAWDPSDWGYNSGKAFNCFVDIRSVGHAAREGFSQHVTSKGQIACSFHPEFLNLYLVQRSSLHQNKYSDEELKAKNLALQAGTIKTQETIPDVTNLIQFTVDIFKSHGQILTAEAIELKIIDFLNLKDYLNERGEASLKQLSDRLAWARFYLKRSGLIQLISDATWQITDAGRSQPVDPVAVKEGRF